MHNQYVFLLRFKKTNMNSKNKNLFIRVDAGIEIGDGHFLRCLTLVSNLKRKFNEIIFVSNQLPKHFFQTIEKIILKYVKLMGIPTFKKKK